MFNTFIHVYYSVFFQDGNKRWNGLDAPESQLYPWDLKSTYIKSPPFFENMVSCYFVNNIWGVSHYIDFELPLMITLFIGNL